MTAILWQRNDEWVGTEIEDSFVMVHLTSGRYLTFNQTARIAWTMLEGPCSQDDIERQFQASFEVSAAECNRDVSELFQRMIKLKLVAPA